MISPDPRTRHAGLDYQDPDYVLADGDEVALLPPVQGG
jgi:molybdopterin converting factor small subunit